MPAYGQPLYTTDLAEMVAVEAVSQGDSGHWAQVMWSPCRHETVLQMTL